MTTAVQVDNTNRTNKVLRPPQTRKTGIWRATDREKIQKKYWKDIYRRSQRAKAKIHKRDTNTETNEEINNWGKGPKRLDVQTFNNSRKLEPLQWIVKQSTVRK